MLSQSFAAPATGGYQVQIPGLAPPQEAPKPALNINELFQKLVASGFVKTQEKPSEPAAPTVQVSSSANPPGTSYFFCFGNGTSNFLIYSSSAGKAEISKTQLISRP